MSARGTRRIAPTAVVAVLLAAGLAVLAGTFVAGIRWTAYPGALLLAAAVGLGLVASRRRRRGDPVR